MPQVRFTQDPKLPMDWKNKPYKKDWVGNMTQDEADRWVRRGVAEMVSENKEVIRGGRAEEAKSSEVKIPPPEPDPIMNAGQTVINFGSVSNPGSVLTSATVQPPVKK